MAKPQQPGQLPVNQEFRELRTNGRLAGLMVHLAGSGNTIANLEDQLASLDLLLGREREQHAAELQAKDAEIAALNLELAQLKGQRT